MNSLYNSLYYLTRDAQKRLIFVAFLQYFCLFFACIISKASIGLAQLSIQKELTICIVSVEVLLLSVMFMQIVAVKVKNPVLFSLTEQYSDLELMIRKVQRTDAAIEENKLAIRKFYAFYRLGEDDLYARRKYITYRRNRLNDKMAFYASIIFMIFQFLCILAISRDFSRIYLMLLCSAMHSGVVLHLARLNRGKNRDIIDKMYAYEAEVIKEKVTKCHVKTV